MNDLFSILISPEFRGAMFNLSIVSLVLAIGIVIVAFTYYGRGREADAFDGEKYRWVMLMATMRDSLIITLLYVAESLSYSFSEFAGLANIMADSVVYYPSIAQPILSFVVRVLIFVVAALRIIALSRWLAGMKEANQS